MDIELSWDERGWPLLLLGGRPVAALTVEIPGREGWSPEELTLSGWEGKSGADELGPYRAWTAVVSREEEAVFAPRLISRGEAVEFEVKLLRGLRGLFREDSFETLSIHAPYIELRGAFYFLAVTYGLGASGSGYPGGYWPAAVTGRGAEELPRQALSPLVTYDGEAALAISPGNYFLTSALVKHRLGVARGLHGSVDRLPAGFTVNTVFLAAKTPQAALYGLGAFLRKRSGKTPALTDHPLLTRLGYWNAYGSYYTELLRPLAEEELVELAAGFRRDGLPVDYFGLDLWYQFEEIGKAIRYRPDPRKYPRGLAALRSETGLPYVLHLSALAEANAYGSSGDDPSVYQEIARELKSEGAIAAWHDWLRTEQHLYHRLRAEPEAAEAWFDTMVRSFSHAGLPVLLCMQTMGMVLASTQHESVISARSYTDFLFSQRGALEEALRRGHVDLMEGWIQPAELRRQNIGMGMVLEAFGLAPFHDLFLSRPHPGFGGDRPEEEAALRALSRGPVGIGDGPGMWDRELIGRLVLPDGTIARPDHTLRPELSSLASGLLTAWTETGTPEGRWLYGVALNTTAEGLEFALEPREEGDWLAWDVFGRAVLNKPAGELASGRLAYFLFAPVRAGIAPIGYADKLVPAPAGRLALEPVERGWLVKSSEEGLPLLIWSPAELIASPKDGRLLGLERQGDLWKCQFEGTLCEIKARRR